MNKYRPGDTLAKTKDFPTPDLVSFLYSRYSLSLQLREGYTKYLVLDT